MSRAQKIWAVMEEAGGLSSPPVQLSKTSLTDPHIVKVLTEYASNHGLTIDQVNEMVIEQVKHDSQYDTPKLFDKNVVEGAVFTHFFEIEEITREDFCKTYRPIIFELITDVKNELDSGNGLINRFVTKAVDPNIIFVPGDANHKQFDDEKIFKTAFCTPGALIGFNWKFLVKLIKWGEFKGIKCSGAKYQSNKKAEYYHKYPDAYSYIEFLIRHEFGHYQEADHFYSKIFRQRYALDHNISEKTVSDAINFAGDYRMNYLLCYMGLPQLPIGLFSDTFNTLNPKYASWSNLFKGVLDAMLEQEKMFPPPPPPPGKPGKEGEGEGPVGPGGGEGEGPTREGEGGDNGRNKDLDRHRSKQGTDTHIEDGKTDKPVDSDDWANKQDENSKKDREKADIDKGNIETGGNAAEGSDGPTKGGEKGQLGGGNTGGGSSQLYDNSGLDNYVPSVNWKRLIRNLVSVQSGKEDTYSRMPRQQVSISLSNANTSNSTSIILAGEKPGIVKKRNVLIILDSSGSMESVRAKIAEEIVNLVNRNAKLLHKVYLAKFSGTHQVWEIHTTTKKASLLPKGKLKAGKMEVENDKEVKANQNVNALQVIRQSYGSSTDFTPALVKDLIEVAKSSHAGLSTMIITDTDILIQQNLNSVKALRKVIKNISLLLGSAGDYRTVMKSGEFPPKNISCVFPDDQKLTKEA